MAYLRFDTQIYGSGLLAFDTQNYSAGAGSNTVQNVFVDLFILPNATQIYTPAAAAGNTSQTGSSALLIATNAAQAYAAYGGPVATVQSGNSGVMLIANAAQGYVKAGTEEDVVTCRFTIDNLPVKKRRRPVVEEQAAAVLKIDFLDALGAAAAAPLTVNYRIDCRTTGAVIRPLQAAVASASMVLRLTSADNALIDQDNMRELRRVTVQAVYASGEVVNAQFDYLVRNLSGVI